MSAAMVYGATAGLQAISSIYAGKAQAEGYKIQEINARLAAKRAESQAKYTSMKLTQNYNDIMAKNMAISAASGRSISSESVQAIIEADENKLAWDLDYIELSGQMQKEDMLSQAKGYEFAGRAAEYAGIQKGLLGAGQSYAQYKMIK